MPEFQRKNNKFLHKGINLNAPVDLIPDGQVPYARNVRVTQAGTISQRPGLTLYSDRGNGYTHTITRLNNSDANVNFSRALVVSKDATLYVAGAVYGIASEAAANAAVQASLADAARNPVALPEGITLSGNPLSIADMAPVGSNAGWKYCGDSGGNFAIGYYPGDDPRTNKARVVRMGMKPPVIGTGNANLLVFNTGTDNLVGPYQWLFAFRNKYTGARSNPSAPTRDSQANIGTVLANGYVTMTLPAVPGYGVVVDIYRFGGNVDDWRYVGTGDGGSVFTDNTADSEILTAATPPEITDLVTGVTRFNIYQPFITQDHARFGTGTLNVSTGGVWSLTWASGDHFDPGWLQGSFISINNGSFSIYEASSDTQLIVAEDLSGMTVGGIPVASGTVVSWSTHAGTLTMGAAMSHIWGPYGLGQTGAYIFGCGDPNNVGTLYWTNGNDPDSTDLVNSLIVTSPSEPLRGGCIYDGTPFVFSTERMFRIYPGTVAGQFTVQEIPGSKGLWAQWSLTVQSNGIADQSITWVGKDGIYDWSASGGLRTMTDRDLYPFFPHDNQPGVDVATLLPWLGEPFPVLAPNFDEFKIKYHRLCWFQGELFYDFPAGTADWHTLVHDTKEVNGWVSLDQYPAGGGGSGHEAIGRGTETAGNNMFVAVGGKLMTNTGLTDNGATIPCRFTTRSDDLGDPRAVKLYGDYMVDSSTGGINVGVYTWVDNYKTSPTNTTFSTAARAQKVLDLTTGLGLLGGSHALDFRWDATAPVTLYQWAYSFVAKPELTYLRATDKTDEGYNGPKYLRGLCIEANTFNVARTVKVLVDGTVAATLSLTANGQLETPFAITPLVGNEFQLQPTDANTWELFAIRWVWEKWPDFTVLESNWMDLGTAKPKYIRSFSMPIAAPPLPQLGFLVTYDGGNTYATAVATPFSTTAKSPAQFSFNAPILAHQLKLMPSQPCRCWYDQIVWDAEEWPELATLHGPIEKLSDSGAKYLRGFELPVETNGQNVVIRLRYDSGNDTSGTLSSLDFPAISTTPLAKVVFPLTPSSAIIAHEFQLVSLSPARFWYSEVKWDFEPWPEFSDGVCPWQDGGTVGAKFVRGITIPVDTGGLPVSFTIFTDAAITVTFGPFTTTAGNKSSVYCGFTVPLIIHEFQLRPQGNCRIWHDEIKWDADPWPEFEVESSAWLDNGTPSAKYIRGITIPIDSGGPAVTLDIYTDTGQVVSFGPFTTSPSVKTSVYCGLPVPLIIHQFRIQPRTNCRCWYGEIKWDADPWPENETASSAWDNATYEGAKFVQGVLIPMDTSGQPVSFQVIHDGFSGSPITIGPFSAPAGQKTTIAYSFPVPFICHNLMLTPSGNCRVWYDEIKWIWEPVPELVTTYTTQETDLDLPGYHYQYDAYIAYIGSADAPVLHIKTEYGTIDYVLPVSNGVFTRAHVQLQPQKAKWRSFSITSTGGIRLFLKDCELRAKNWTDKGNYPSAFTSHHPFGHESRMIGARI